MTKATWWMRIIGMFYLIQFVMMVIVRAPIRALGPEGALALAAAGDPTARFLVDTWTIFGLEVGGIGAVLLLASRKAGQAKALIWTIIAIELTRGIVADMNMIVRGYDLTVCVVWIIIHSVIIVTGLAILRNIRSVDGRVIEGEQAP